LKKILINILWFVLAVALLYVVFRGASLQDLQDRINQINYFWLTSGLVLSLYCHWLRGYRWKMLMETSGEKVSTLHAFGAVMVGYMVNYALPRVGELTRCTILYKSDRVPLPTAIGTVFTERVVDILTLGLLSGTVFLTEFDVLASYILQQNEGRSFRSLYILLGLAVAGLLVLWVLYRFRRRLLQIGIVRKVYDFILTFRDAVLGIFKLKRPALFILVSLAIWLGYITVNYLIMKAMRGTSDLSYYTAVIITAMGGIAMVVPAPGGTGPFHFAVTETFRMYRLNVDLGRALALVIHTPQLVLNSLVGGFFFFYLARKEKTWKEEE
jgi:uncharacterized protein (TIRG00374 family)